MISRKPDRALPAAAANASLFALLGCSLAIAWGLLRPLSANAAPKSKSDPVARIQLAPLGYQSPPQSLLLMNYSTLALHFVDAEHLLLTFNSRSLLRRIPNDPPDDSDQQVTALLLSVPRNGGPETGKLLGWTEWRLHDHSQYLWPMGHGRFLLRQGLELRVIAPLEKLRSTEPLSSRLLTTLPNPPAFLQLSPDSKLMVVQMENQPPRALAGDSTKRMQVGSSVLEKTYDIQFAELNPEVKSADELTYHVVGDQRSATPLEIPMVPAGYLDSSRLGMERWHVTFGPAVAGGKRTDLFDIISTCRPSMEFISGDEFLVGGCQRNAGRFSRGGYTLDGKELWRYDFPDPSVMESLTLAEGGVRFVLSRILTSLPLGAGQEFAPDVATAQEITVYQARTGESVFRITPSPMQSDGRNYALSPDGGRLAVVTNGAIEVFNLPPVAAASGKK